MDTRDLDRKERKYVAEVVDSLSKYGFVLDHDYQTLEDVPEQLHHSDFETTILGEQKEGLVKLVYAFPDNKEKVNLTLEYENLPHQPFQDYPESIDKEVNSMINSENLEVDGQSSPPAVTVSVPESEDMPDREELYSALNQAEEVLGDFERQILEKQF